MSINPPIIEFPGNNPPEIISGENLNTIIYTGPSKGSEVTVTDNTNIVSDSDLIDTSFTYRPKGGNITSELSLKLLKKSEVKTESPFSARYIFKSLSPSDYVDFFGVRLKARRDPSASSRAAENGLIQRTSVTGGNKGDSVKFTGKTTVQRSSLDMGKGADTVTFGGKTQFVGKSTLDLGPAGGKADKVIFKGSNTAEGGKVVIENFDSKDKLLVNGEVLKQSDLEDGAKIDGIKIEFAD